MDSFLYFIALILYIPICLFLNQKEQQHESHKSDIPHTLGIFNLYQYLVNSIDFHNQGVSVFRYKILKRLIAYCEQIILSVYDTMDL